MAGFFKNLINKFQNFLFEEVVVDEQGNEKVVDNKVDKNISSRIDVVADYTEIIEEQLTDKEEDLEKTIEAKPVVKEKLPEKEVTLKQPEVKKEEKLTKKPSMFVDFDTSKSDSTDKKVEVKDDKVKPAYVPQRVISPIFGSDKDSYAITINNLEYDSEKPKRSVIGTVFSPIFGRDRIIEDTVDEVDEKIANMTTSDFISDDIQTEKKEEDLIKEVEEVEPPKPLYAKLTVEEKPVVYLEKTAETKDEVKPIENVSLFDAERVNKALNEAKVAFDEIEKAAKPLENTASYENISLFD